MMIRDSYFEAPGANRKQKRNVMLIVAGLGFIAIIIQLFYLQIEMGDYFKNAAESNRFRVEILKAPRGIIYSRSKRILVDNYPSYSISIIPKELKEREKTLEILAGLTETPVDYISDKLSEYSKYFVLPVEIIRDADISIVSRVAEQNNDLPGVLIEVKSKRNYHFDHFLAHITGYVGNITKKEYQRLKPKGYKYNDIIGRFGIEKMYEKELKGADGYNFIEVNTYGEKVDEDFRDDLEEAQNGQDIILTVDIDVQRKIFEAFPDTLKGAVVCMDPNTGGIIAMASFPSFSPNKLSVRISKEDWKLMNDPVQSPLINRVIQSAYPPGSTFKPVTITYALEQDIINTGFTVNCPGGMQYGNRFFKCWKHSGHGNVDLIKSLRESCDTYFYTIAKKMDVDDFSVTAKKFHFAQKTGIDLHNEVSGLIPSTAYYDRVFGERKWSKGNFLNISIGQGEILTTPLQLAVAYSIIANNGYFVKPYLIKSLNGVKTEVQREKVDIDPIHMELIHEGLYEVVHELHGTGYWARIKGFTASGKTGTAQNPHGEDHALFVGYAPSENPQIVCAVVVENGGHGSSAAAPVFSAAVQEYLDKEKKDADKD